MVLASTSVFMTKQAPKMAATNVYMFPGKISATFCLSRRPSESDPGSFQITASWLRFGMCEILFVPFSSRVFIPYSPPALFCKLHWPSKPDVLGACLLGGGPQASEPSLRLGPLAPWGEPLQL